MNIDEIKKKLEEIKNSIIEKINSFKPKGNVSKEVENENVEENDEESEPKEKLDIGQKVLEKVSTDKFRNIAIIVLGIVTFFCLIYIIYQNSSFSEYKALASAKIQSITSENESLKEQLGVSDGSSENKKTTLIPFSSEKVEGLDKGSAATLNYEKENLLSVIITNDGKASIVMYNVKSDIASNYDIGIEEGKPYEITGIEGKIVDYKLKYTNGQKLTDPVLFLLLEDGTVVYVNTVSGLKSGKFEASGKLATNVCRLVDLIVMSTNTAAYTQMGALMNDGTTKLLRY